MTVYLFSKAVHVHNKLLKNKSDAHKTKNVKLNIKKYDYYKIAMPTSKAIPNLSLFLFINIFNRMFYKIF